MINQGSFTPRVWILRGGPPPNRWWLGGGVEGWGGQVIKLFGTLALSISTTEHSRSSSWTRVAVAVGRCGSQSAMGLLPTEH
eukprot:CAMPEP_0118964430 /NCGR_PEP_ID=MMETSP1173-20130426/2123_1 /TAXON_ID=1034831 /ORGANISM="Rhizochromulina marina cf, Strain CCMP1243" /LENGTH=81 /DNA_ID=CAMNT_0006912885 /DNA_START=349 /DNA_END=591 /DNA_ORIENTATION=-